MANNVNAILAGEAYVRYFAKNDEFRRGNREAADDFQRTQDRMRQIEDRYTGWRAGLIQRRAAQEKATEDRYTVWRVGLIGRRANEEKRVEDSYTGWRVGLLTRRASQEKATEDRYTVWRTSLIAKRANDEKRIEEGYTGWRAGLLKRRADTEKRTEDSYTSWRVGLLQRRAREEEKAQNRAQDQAQSDYIKQLRFNSRVLEMQQASEQKAQQNQQRHQDWVQNQNARMHRGLLALNQKRTEKEQDEQYKRIKINSTVLEHEEKTRKRADDLAHAEYIRKVKFNSKILELQQSTDKQSQDRAYADYIKIVRFNSRVLEMRQNNQRRAEKTQRDHENELQRIQQQSLDLRERSTDAFYDRQERKRKQRLSQEARDLRAAETDRARIEQQGRDRENAMRTLAVGGTMLGSRLSSAGQRGLGSVLGAVQEYGNVESSLLSLKVSVRDNTQDIVGDMRMLEKEAYRIGVKTEYDARQVASMMDRLGISNLTPKQIADNSGSVINVASVYSNQLNGKVDPSRAARSVMEIISAMNYQISEIPKVSDKMAMAGRLADISLENLGDAFRYAGGSAKEAGMEFDDILAALVVLDKRGLKGEMGGTALRGIIASVLDPTDNAKAEYEKFGINIPKTGKLNLADVIRQFETKLGKMSDVERAAVIAKAFPNRQMTGVQMLIGGADQLDTMRGRFAGAAGAGDMLAGAKREGVSFGMDVVGSSWESARGAFGKSISEETNWLSHSLAGGLDLLGRTFTKFPVLGKSLAGLAVGVSALGVAVGTAGAGAGVYFGIRATNAALLTMGYSLTGLASAAVSGTASLAAAAASAAAWPTAIAAGLGSIGIIIDDLFNGGVNNQFLAGQMGLAGPATIQEDRDGLRVTSAEFARRPGRTFTRDASGRITGDQNSDGTDKRTFRTMPHQGRPFEDVSNQMVLGPDGKPIDPYSGHPIPAGNIVTNAYNAGQGLLQGLGGYAASAVTAGMGLLGQQQAHAREVYDPNYAKKKADRERNSPENPENARAWRAFAQANPIVPGFELESEQGRADQWNAFLKNHRMQELLKKNQPTGQRALSQLGDYELRSQTGQNYILDLLSPKKKTGMEEIPEQQLAEQKKTNALLGQLGVDPKFLNKRR